MRYFTYGVAKDYSEGKSDAERIYELERRVDEAERRLDAHYRALEDLAKVLCSLLPEEMVSKALAETKGKREADYPDWSVSPKPEPGPYFTCMGSVIVPERDADHAD